MSRAALNKKQTLKTQAAKVDDYVLRQFVGYQLKRAYNVVRADLSRQLDTLGLRITTYSCLLLITENPGVRQSELAETLDIERPNMVAILDELEQLGWIKRERVPTDRRAYALNATAAGKRICKQAVALDRKHETRLLKHLDDKQIKKLIDALKKIEDTLEETSDGIA